MRELTKFALAAALAAALAGIGCVDTKPMDGDHAKTAPAKPLYERLGGKPAITKVVDDFVPLAATDPKVNFFRDGKYKLDDKGVAKLKEHLVNFIGMATGGPEKYTGRSMKESHAGMKITMDEFNALAGDLVKALEKNKVPADLQKELVDIVATTAKDIVEVPAKK
jgi:hemoglobin